MFLYMPFTLVPKDNMDKQTFFKEWLQINKNKKIVLNHDAAYHMVIQSNIDNTIWRYVFYTTSINGNNEEGNINIENGINEENGGDTRYGTITILTLYSNGQFMTEESLIDKGKTMGQYTQGIYTSWYPSGQIDSQGNYDDGLKQGIWYSWYENGQLKTEEPYLDGYLQGLYTKWSHDGKIIEQKQYNKKSKTIICYIWYDNMGQGTSQGVGEDETS